VRRPGGWRGLAASLLRISPRLVGLRGAPVDGPLREREARACVGEYHAHAGADPDTLDEVGRRQLAVGRDDTASLAFTPFEQEHSDTQLRCIKRLEVQRVERQQCRGPCADRALGNDCIVGAPAGEPGREEVTRMKDEEKLSEQLCQGAATRDREEQWSLAIGALPPHSRQPAHQQVGEFLAIHVFAGDDEPA